ncbi:MAG: trigger factor [Bacteroidetes bacterium]|nr:MAG: trigger factor [Bacteroidota bacterium]
MNIVREELGDLVAVLKVTVTPDDYQKKVEETLSKYRKQANLPGFRSGKVPMGMIRKQYGKAVLAEELNKVVNEGLQNYISEEKLDILGNPIPKEDFDVKGNFDQPSEFEFEYEIGLSPEVSVKLSGRNKFDYYKVKIDDKLIDQQVDDLRRRYGKLEPGDQVEEHDMILGQFVELNDDESIKEGGILHSSTISLEFIEDKKTQKALLAKKEGDQVILDPEKVSRGESDMAAMLGIKPEELDQISKKFQFTINQIRRMKLADLNQELFDKLFGEGNLKSEKELRERIANDLESMFSNDSDRLLTRAVHESLLEKTDVKLPNDFLKRWIQMTNEKPITMEEIEQDYPNYEKGMKWQLIQSAIFKENNIKLESAEVIEFTKGLLLNQYAQYGMPAPEEKELMASVTKVLSNQQESARVYDMLAENKLTQFFKETVKTSEKLVSHDEFMKLAQA